MRAKLGIQEWLAIASLLLVHGGGVAWALHRTMVAVEVNTMAWSISQTRLDRVESRMDRIDERISTREDSARRN